MIFIFYTALRQRKRYFQTTCSFSSKYVAYGTYTSLNIIFIFDINLTYNYFSLRIFRSWAVWIRLFTVKILVCQIIQVIPQVFFIQVLEALLRLLLRTIYQPSNLRQVVLFAKIVLAPMACYIISHKRLTHFYFVLFSKLWSVYFIIFSTNGNFVYSMLPY